MTQVDDAPRHVHLRLGASLEIHTLHRRRSTCAMAIRHSPKKREQDRERRTGPEAAIDLDTPSVRMHHVLRDSETEAGPTHPALNR